MRDFKNIIKMIESSNKDNVYAASKILGSNEFVNNSEAIILLNKIPLIDRIKNYSDVCKELKLKELTIKDFSFLPIDQQLKSLSFHKLKNIEKLFAGDWKLSWKDKNQRKWYPWFEDKGLPGLGFGRSSYSVDYSSGAVAYFSSEEISDFIGKTFLDLYKGILE
jgi:hypothetical protein